MEKVQKVDYSIVRKLFAPLEVFQPMCTAVLEGIWPGDIWVDDLVKSQSALLLTFLSGGGPAWCFLAGNPGNADFNAAVNKALFDDRVAGQGTGAFLFTCFPEDWHEHLDIVGHPRQPVPMDRQHYVCREMVYDWQYRVPVGYDIQPMTVDLLNRVDLQLPPAVKTTLEKWKTVQDARFQDYGFVAVFENQVVAWATVDFVATGAGDLGFETLHEYQKRGLGSAMAAVAMAHGLDLGIETHWTCAANNIPSQRTAQKLGLYRERDYTMYLFVLDMAEHLAQLAYAHLARGEHRRAIDSYEALFAQEAEVPIWAYFDTAQAYAALGECEGAIKYLHMAAGHGWSAVEMTEQTPEFQILQNLPEWVDVIEKMRQNRQQPSS